MKIRYDFVTNSSSSSFIFGFPGENSITSEDVMNNIRDIAKKILCIMTYMDDMIKDIKYMGDYFINTVRNRGENYNYNLSNKMEQDLLERKDIESAVMFKCKEIRLDTDWENIVDFYGSYNDIKVMKELAKDASNIEEILNVRLINFRDKSNNIDRGIYEILGWYGSDLDRRTQQKFKNDTQLSEYERAHKYFGEVAIYSSNDKIPYILKLLLMDEVLYGCLSMG